MLSEAELDRYRRHIQLEPIAEAGQRRIKASRALIIGLGGLGSPVSIYLASAGIGSLTLVDFDRVERSNLSRQIVHRTADIDRNKVDSARDTLLALNPHVQIDTIPALRSLLWGNSCRWFSSLVTPAHPVAHPLTTAARAPSAH